MKCAILFALFVLGATGQNISVAQVSPWLNFTSEPTTTFTVGQVGSFMVITEPTDLYLYPLPPVLDVVIPNPAPLGVTFTDNLDATGTFAGTPISAGSFPILIRAWAPTQPPKTTLLVSQNFGLTVNQGQTTTTVGTECLMRTFTENQPFTFIANAVAVGSGLPGGTMTYTQNPGNIILCTVGIPPGGGCTTTALATSGSDTQDSYYLVASYSGNADWQPSDSFPIGVTVLKAADVVFRDDNEYIFDGCPAG